MSASFNGSTYFTGSFASITAYPFTIYCRAQSTSSTAQGHAFYMGSVGANDDAHSLAFRGDVSGDPMQFRRTGPVGGIGINSVAGYTVNTWVDVAGVAAADADGRLYFNNVRKNDTTSVTFANGNVMIGGFMALNASSDRLNGLVADCAIWDVSLTDDEISSLYKGFSPRRIRPQSLKFYAPLVRQVIDTRAGVTLSVTGTASVGVHPRSYGI